MTDHNQEEPTIVNEIHRPLYSFFKRSDGIIVEITGDNTWFTITKAKEVVDSMNQITGGVPHLLLFMPGKHMSMDKEARSFMATAEALKDVKAMAVIEGSLTQRIIVNLYLKVDKPVVPVRMFKTVDEAVKWLKEQ